MDLESMNPRAESDFEALQRWFGPSWKWSEIAAWIEARSRSQGMPEFAKVWAYDFMRRYREQRRDEWV